MANSRGSLLWITYDGSISQHSHELRSALKQHVMLNSRGKKAPEANGRIMVHRRSSSPKNDVKIERESIERLACPQPAPALVSHRDQLVYRAAWWHSYVHPDFSMPSTDVPEWQSDCKRAWNVGFWQWARQDETLLEVFMSFAAAKEAAVKHLTDAPAYYHHKGKALTLLSEDVGSEGAALRMVAIYAIALFSYTYFLEGHYESAELHCRALAKLISARLNEFKSVPDVVWTIIISADMFLTAIHVRPPSIPYYLHENFRSLYFYNPSDGIIDAATRNLRKFPIETVFAKDQAHSMKRILQGLHLIADAHGRFDIDRTVAWGPIYDVYRLLAQLQVEFDRQGSLKERIVFIGCQMQFYGMMTIFSSQPDIQSHHLRRLEQVITSTSPTDLCSRWLKHTGDLDLLLWTLCNAGVSVLYLDGPRKLATDYLPHWLQHALEHVIDRLQITRSDDLKAHLQQMPFTDRWNDRACQSFAVWSRIVPTSPDSTADRQSHSSPGTTLFERQRLAFDYWLRT